MTSASIQNKLPLTSLPVGEDSAFNMADLPNPIRLVDAAVLLLGANLASELQLLSLRALVAGYPNVLHFTALLEILLKALPETVSPADFISIVYRSYRRETEQIDISRIPASYVTH